MRIVATLLLAIPRAEAIITGFVLLGLSHSMGFVIARKILGQFQEQGAFFKMSLATNIAYFVMPHVGALLMRYWLPVAFGMSLACSVSSYAILKRIPPGIETNMPDRAETPATVATDCALFALFLLPYGIMMALVAVKTYLAGYTAAENALLISINSAVVLTVLVTSLKIRLPTDSSTYLWGLGGCGRPVHRQHVRRLCRIRCGFHGLEHVRGVPSRRYRTAYIRTTTLSEETAQMDHRSGWAVQLRRSRLGGPAVFVEESDESDDAGLLAVRKPPTRA